MQFAVHNDTALHAAPAWKRPEEGHWSVIMSTREYMVQPMLWMRQLRGLGSRALQRCAVLKRRSNGGRRFV